MRWLLVDRIDELVVGEHVRGAKAWTMSEPWVQDHFPGFPVVPGVLLLESMAQISGKLIGYTVRKQRGDWPFPIFTMAEKVKFRRFVRPGQVVELKSSFIALREESAVMKVRALVDGKVCAQAEETFVFNAVAFEDEAESLRVEGLEKKALAMLWADCPKEDR
ncbi:MAG: beta-hydroxyacyl-ACP dehydratase [Proteobacteria bacterium]|nr:beta-hydroxyacyl-ACP dehydratase [Pseudomonadota bacterium]MCP4917938.1 beta-hydroxyacyl-ACP dehydratase [Pseudomonadota bacterium]